MFVIVGLIILVGLVGFWIFNLNDNGVKENGVKGDVVRSSGNGTQAEMPIVTKENLPAFVGKQTMIQELPEKAAILIRFYNFDSGEREVENSYLIKKGSIVEASGDEKVDLVVYMHSKYIPELGWFCSAIKKARSNGDFSFEMKGSKIGLLWKYRGMMKYKDCVG